MPVFETLRELIERNEKLYPDDLCLIYEDWRLSFRDFAARTRRLAAALYDLGARHQDRVSILAMNCPEYIEVYGVGDYAGYIVAPINFRLAPPEIAYILRDASPVVLIFESQYAEVIDGLRKELPGIRHYVCIGDEIPAWAIGYETLLASGAPEGPPLTPAAGDIATILYTSGTTGRPKGVMTTHEQNVWLAEMQAFENASDLGDKFLIMMPYYHLGGRSMTLGHHFRAGTVVMHRKFDPLDIARTIERERITQIHLAPTMLQQVLDLPGIEGYDLSSLKSLQHAAAPMSVTLLKRALEKFGPILIDGFGQTEGGGTTLRRHQHKLEGSEKEVKRLASVGQPQLHARLKIVDAQDKEVPVGTVGEICFKSPQNMLGYWNNAQATIETLRGGWLHTGDLGYVDEESFLYLVDRKKDMIISGGENVYSREVEEALMTHGGLVDVAVIGLPDERWGEAVTAVVIARTPGLTEADLIAHCRTRIAGYKCPKRVEFVDDLPRVPSGKVNKVVLRQRYKQPG